MTILSFLLAKVQLSSFVFTPSLIHKAHKTYEQNTKYKYKHKTNVESNAAATFAPFEHQK